MITYKGPISDPSIKIKPSEILYKYISRIDIHSENVPSGICSILSKNKKVSSYEFKLNPKYLLVADDFKKINSWEECSEQELSHTNSKPQKKKVVDKILGVQDLRWLYEYIKEENRKNPTKVYLHELMEGSEVLLPENSEIPRNPELEKRCQRLKIEQENRKYQNITKNVDNVRKRLPEDTIAYQMKEMNKQLIAVFQFVVSVLAGFAFGFIGVEVFVGALDFGFRLLLGIMFALIIALAELYFLAKKLNEDYGEPVAHVEKSKID
ncbi:hypothetical protein HHI36_023449 [Cryptolaemus montrouzieri]|uniref:Transmembrane protein 199 n=1 Tax=Cryptolaemus montrouzieri TaxID=559131 RepID=A0ABD2PH88_9CUCU